MRICFLCIGYEPERDGVGDYVRGLVKYLPAAATAIVVAINDDKIAAYTADRAAGVIRIPAGLSTTERYRLAQEAIEDFYPDVISLQLVCWAFGPKGVILRERRLLSRLLSGRTTHIMFHEPWVRPATHQRSARELYRWGLGRLQRQSVIFLTASLRPELCHTSNVEYQNLFTDAGIKTGILPIFGSIAPTGSGRWDVVRALASGREGAALATRESYFVLTVFGAIRDYWDAGSLMDRLASQCHDLGRRLLIMSIGHNTDLGLSMIQSWKERSPVIDVIFLGRQSTENISEAISCSDFGLAHQRIPAMGRSTTTAALLEHGVPVIAGFGDTKYANDPFLEKWGSMIFDGSSIDIPSIIQARSACSIDIKPEVAWSLYNDFLKISV